ncbi:conserved membrane hypothetical protein [Agrobacterium tumefaciens str. Kerr 14]|uniref:Branched-chain amino acid transport n=1 Tax=Agrobacterium tumefaciens str. Kerr 14 TaxID=1183424 RepID=A0A1S7SEM2_AGRTU|nr:hypothetical protein [Agrobacterium tumefaciens]CUX67513.1 conserved membrane hypothetical protein [Agrobacterium tumefaciens str. Kerr 14]
MWMNVFTCLLLIVALALSLRRFIVPYVRGEPEAEATSPVTMVASAVFLAALALTVSDTDITRAALTLAGGVLLALLLDGATPWLMVTLSAVCLLVYLGLR